MTKDLHPELGSGALREALAELCNMWEAEKETELPTERSKWYEMALRRCAGEVRRALLSLSSPIEPASTPGEDAWLDEIEHAIVGGNLMSDRDKLRTILRAYRANLLAQPIPQASSEIREQSLGGLQERWEHIAEHGEGTPMTDNFHFRCAMERCAAELKLAMAPSSQGAAKRVSEFTFQRGRA